jgi:IclR family KDG regulon transcriptional repressor
MSYTIAAVDAALELLEALASNSGAGVTKLAEQTGSTKSHVFRMLYTLEKRGYVARNESTRGYTLGYRAVLLGEQAKGQTNLLQAARPVMDVLTKQAAENTHLVVREGLRSLTLAVSQGPHNLGLYAKPGRLGPLHAGGGSKVLLAHAPAEIQAQILEGELERFSDWTVVEPDKLRRLLLEIRQSGYHVCEHDLDEGAFSVAAPIRDHKGEVVAAISIAGPVLRLDDEVLEQHIQAVRQAAEDVSRLIGAPR